MKKEIYIGLLALTALLCSSCGDKVSDNGGSSVTSNSASPFDIKEIESSGSSISAMYGWGLADSYDVSTMSIKVDSKALQLDTTFENSYNECEVGLLVFVDGVAQKYSLEKDGEKKYLTPIMLAEKTDTDKTIYLEMEYGAEGKEHELFMGSVISPSYKAIEKNSSYGNKHDLLSIPCWRLLTEDIKNTSASLFTTIKNSDITEDISVEYNKENKDGTKRNKLDVANAIRFEQNNEAQHKQLDMTKSFKIQYMGQDAKNYRLSLFVDNELVPIAENKYYADVTTEKGKMASIDVDPSVFKEYVSSDSFCYVAICPLNDANDGLLEISPTLNLR